MRSSRLSDFVGEVRTALEPVLEELGFNYAGEVDEPFLEKSCIFQSSMLQIVVGVGSDYQGTIEVLLKRTEWRFLLGRRVSKLNLEDLAEAMGCDALQGNPIKDPDDVKKEIERLRSWISRNGSRLVSVDADLWRRGEEALKIRLERWRDFSKDPRKAKLYHQKRREARAAKERGDLAAFVNACEGIEKWLGLGGKEELERARREIADS